MITRACDSLDIYTLTVSFAESAAVQPFSIGQSRLALGRRVAERHFGKISTVDDI